MDTITYQPVPNLRRVYIDGQPTRVYVTDIAAYLDCTDCDGKGETQTGGKTAPCRACHHNPATHLTGIGDRAPGVRLALDMAHGAPSHQHRRATTPSA